MLLATCYLLSITYYLPRVFHFVTPHCPASVLARLGYDTNPAKLQLIIRTLHRAIEKKGFVVEGTYVTPFALFEVLDPSPSPILA